MKTKLNARERTRFAAVAGVSNAGLDAVIWPKGRKGGVCTRVAGVLADDRADLDAMVYRIVGGHAETEEVMDGFLDEARHWFKTARETREDIERIWPEIAEAVWPKVEGKR